MEPTDFNWYLIFNYDEFVATGLVSRTYNLDLQGIGNKDILVTKGNLLSMTYDGVMVSLDLNSKNPFMFDGIGITKVEPSGNVYLGVLK